MWLKQAAKRSTLKTSTTSVSLLAAGWLVPRVEAAVDTPSCNGPNAPFPCKFGGCIFDLDAAGGK